MVVKVTQQSLKKSPFLKANFISKLFFCWMNGIFNLGNFRELDLTDLYRTLPNDTSQSLGDTMEHHWTKAYEKCKKRNAEHPTRKPKKPSLRRVIVKQFGGYYMLVGLLACIEECFTKIAQPVCLGYLIRYFSDSDDGFTKLHGYLFAAGVVFGSAFYTFTHHPYFFGVQHVGMKIRIACCSVIYRKSLRLSQAALGHTTIGQMVNLLSNDVNRFDQSTIFLHYLWVGPLQTAIVTFILWQYYGPSCLAGLAVLVLFVPFQGYMGRMFSQLRTQTAGKTDKRIRIMNEIVSGIKVIKMYTWEQSFSLLVRSCREEEVKLIRKTSRLRAINMSLFYTSSKIIIFLTLLTYVLTGHSLTAEKVFVTLSLYNNVRLIMTLFFPNGVSLLAEALVSISRIENFLMMEERKVQRPAVPKNEMNGSEIKKKPMDDNVELGMSIPQDLSKWPGLEPIPDLTNLGERYRFSSYNPKFTKKVKVYQEDNGIVVENYSGKWTAENEDNTLTNISLKVGFNELLSVIGPVGSGKSSLLHAILEELPATEGYINMTGKVAYVAQEPWVFAGTIRENILFGKEMDIDWYAKVVVACALHRDFDLLPYGEFTYVGDRGTSLSGGQKARVTLARAVYANADIYLLDDPLSAVDAEVGRHLFEKCICKLLKDKCRILVTHQLQFLKSVSHIILLNSGKIQAEGTYEELSLSNGAKFTQHEDDDDQVIEVLEHDALGRWSIGSDRKSSIGIPIDLRRMTISYSEETFGQFQIRRSSQGIAVGDGSLSGCAFSFDSDSFPDFDREYPERLNVSKIGMGKSSLELEEMRTQKRLQDAASRFEDLASNPLGIVDNEFLEPLTDSKIEMAKTSLEVEELPNQRRLSEAAKVDNIAPNVEEAKVENIAPNVENKKADIYPANDGCMMEFIFPDPPKASKKKKTSQEKLRTQKKPLNDATKVASDDSPCMIDFIFPEQPTGKKIAKAKSSLEEEKLPNDAGIVDDDYPHPLTEIAMAKTSLNEVEELSNQRRLSEEAKVDNIAPNVKEAKVDIADPNDVNIMSKLFPDPPIISKIANARHSLELEDPHANRVILTVTRKTDLSAPIPVGYVIDESFNPKQRINKLAEEVEHDKVNKARIAREAEEEEARPNQQTQESTTTGNVKLSLYWMYFRAGGSFLALFMLLFTNIMTQVLFTGSDYWLNFWTKAEEDTANNKPAPVSSDSAYYPLYRDRDTQIWIYSVIIVALFISSLLRTLVFFNVCMASSVNLHKWMFRGVLRTPMLFFETNPVGRILNRFSKDTGQMDDALPPTFFDTIGIFLNVIGILVIIAIVNSNLLYPAVFLAVVFYFLRRFYLRTARSVKRLEGITRSPVFSHLSTSLYGLTTIRAFKAEEDFIKQFDDFQDMHTSAWYVFIASTRWFGVWLDWISVAYIAIVTFSFMFTDQSGAQVGLAVSSAMMLTGMFQWGVRQSAEVENQMVSVERVWEYTQLKPEAALLSSDATAPPDDWPNAGKIVMKHVRLRYGINENKVLEDINCVILPSEKVGIVGRTGAGKSSLITTLFRMAEPTGKIKIDGFNVLKMGLHDLRSKISIIPQDPVLFSGTLRKNLDPFSKYTDNEIWQVLEEVHLADEVKPLPAGLDVEVAEGGANFSVGQRQLVCLGRAILKRNKILVLDEATANVDPETDSLIQNTIRTKFLDCTVLTVAHRLHTVMDCDRILVLDKGEVKEFDEPITLLKNKESALYALALQTGVAMAANLLRIAEEAYERRKSNPPLEVEEEEESTDSEADIKEASSVSVDLKRQKDRFFLNNEHRVLPPVYGRKRSPTNVWFEPRDSFVEDELAPFDFGRKTTVVEDGEEQKSSVVEEGEKQKSSVVEDGEKRKSSVVEEGEKRKSSVVEEGEKQKSSVVEDGEKQKSSVVEEGEKRKSSVVEDGEKRKSSVVEDGEKQKSSVVEEGEKRKSSVVEDGEKQKSTSSLKVLVEPRDSFVEDEEKQKASVVEDGEKSSPADKRASSSADKRTSSPLEKRTSSPADKRASSSADKRTSSPLEKRTSSPADKRASSSADKRTSSPLEKGEKPQTPPKEEEK